MGIVCCLLMTPKSSVGICRRFGRHRFRSVEFRQHSFRVIPGTIPAEFECHSKFRRNHFINLAGPSAKFDSSGIPGIARIPPDSGRNQWRTVKTSQLTRPRPERRRDFRKTLPSRTLRENSHSGWNIVSYVNLCCLNSEQLNPKLRTAQRLTSEGGLYFLRISLTRASVTTRFAVRTSEVLSVDDTERNLQIDTFETNGTVNYNIITPNIGKMYVYFAVT